jgi:hypothetical protein
VEGHRQGINLKRESSKIVSVPNNEMLVDEDDLEYTKRSKNLESVEKKKNEANTKKKGIPLYEIK